MHIKEWAIISILDYPKNRVGETKVRLELLEEIWRLGYKTGTLSEDIKSNMFFWWNQNEIGLKVSTHLGRNGRYSGKSRLELDHEGAWIQGEELWTSFCRQRKYFRVWAGSWENLRSTNINTLAVVYRKDRLGEK